MKKVIYVTLLLLGACTSVPDTLAGCLEQYTNPLDVGHCEERVIQREDVRARRMIEQEAQESMAQYCWAQKLVYIQRSHRCSHWEIL